MHQQNPSSIENLAVSDGIHDSWGHRLGRICRMPGPNHVRGAPWRTPHIAVQREKVRTFDVKRAEGGGNRVSGRGVLVVQLACQFENFLQ